MDLNKIYSITEGDAMRIRYIKPSAKVLARVCQGEVDGMLTFDKLFPKREVAMVSPVKRVETGVLNVITLLGDGSALDFLEKQVADQFLASNDLFTSAKGEKTGAWEKVSRVHDRRLHMVYKYPAKIAIEPISLLFLKVLVRAFNLRLKENILFTLDVFGETAHYFRINVENDFGANGSTEIPVKIFVC